MQKIEQASQPRPEHITQPQSCEFIIKQVDEEEMDHEMALDIEINGLELDLASMEAQLLNP